MAWNEISPEVRVIVALAPDHTVERSAHRVIRTFTPALNLVGVFGIRHTRRDAIAEVSLYAAEAPRAAVLRRIPTVEQRLRAQVMGVGLLHVSTTSVELDLDAEHRMVSPGPLRWQLQELVFGAWLAQEGRLIPTS